MQGAADVVTAIERGALAMRTFLTDHLPGAKGRTTQLALFVQGCRYHKASLRQVRASSRH